MTIIDLIKQYKTEHNISYRQFASKCDISSGYLSMLVNNNNPQTGKPPKLSIDVYNKLANGMGMGIDELFAMIDDAPVIIPPRQPRPDFIPLTEVRPISEAQMKKVPMIGYVAAGEPISEEEYGVYADSPGDCDAALTVRGDSMEPTYYDGDVLYIRETPMVDKGRIAVVFIDNTAVVKHVYPEPGAVTLVSDNPAYPPMHYKLGENADVIRIYGVPCGFTRMYHPSKKK